MIDEITLESQIEAAEAQAAYGCGLSDVIYEANVQAAYASILASTFEADRETVMAVLKGRGFDPDCVPFEASDGECSWTGIDEDHCPCGAHF